MAGETPALLWRTPSKRRLNAAMARASLYRFLAQAYEDPTEEGWTRMATKRLPAEILEAALRTLAATSPARRGNRRCVPVTTQAGSVRVFPRVLSRGVWSCRARSLPPERNRIR